MPASAKGRRSAISEGLLGPFRSWAYPRIRRSRRVNKAIAMRPKRSEMSKLIKVIRLWGKAKGNNGYLNFFFFFPFFHIFSISVQSPSK